MTESPYDLLAADRLTKLKVVETANSPLRLMRLFLHVANEPSSIHAVVAHLRRDIQKTSTFIETSQATSGGESNFLGGRKFTLDVAE